MIGGSLISYISSLSNQMNEMPNIGLEKDELEIAVAQSYLALKDDIKGIKKRHDNIFDVYLETNSFNTNNLELYLNGIDSLEKAPYKIKGNSQLRKVAYKTSSWYHKRYCKFDRGARDVLMGSGAGFGGLTMAGVSLAGGFLIPFGIGSVGVLSFGAYYGLFSKKTELKPNKYEFQNDGARDYVIELSKLHRLCQKLDEDLEDIETLVGDEPNQLLKKYGQRKIKRDKIKLNGLSPAQKKHRILEYGGIEIIRMMDLAKKEVTTTKNIVERILSNSRVEIIDISQNYELVERQRLDEELARLTREIDDDFCIGQG